LVPEPELTSAAAVFAGDCSRSMFRCSVQRVLGRRHAPPPPPRRAWRGFSTSHKPTPRARPVLKDALEAAAVRRGLQSLSAPAPLSEPVRVSPSGSQTARDDGVDLLASTFRQMAPFIAAHRDATVVIHVPGECLESELFPSLADDIVLLHTLGMKIVLVVGCRPQIDRRLYLAGIDTESRWERTGVRPSDEFVLQQVVESWGWCRVQLQSHVGRGLATGAQIKRLGLQGGMVHVASGNFVIAQPIGVLDGIDMMYAGAVRRINTGRLSQLLDSGDIVLVGCLGYSASGEVFNCSSEDVATACAAQLGAQKLIFLFEGDEVYNLDDSVRDDEVSQGESSGHHTGGRDSRHRARKSKHPVVRSMDPELAKRCIAATEAHLARYDDESGSGSEKSNGLETAGGVGLRGDADLGDPSTRPFGFSWSFPLYLRQAVAAVEGGVQRVHLVNRHVDGSLLGELYTETGNGVLISELGECDDVPAKATLHVR
jgi:acetylglutamate kinase